MKIDKLILLSVVICAIVLTGEFLAYGHNPHNFDADAEFEDGFATITVSSSGSDTYSTILMDNGDRAPLTSLYIYIDEGYDEFYDEAEGYFEQRYLDQMYAAEQISKSLKIRGFHDITLCNGEQLVNLLQEDIGNDATKGLLVMSYALPSTVYSGSVDDLLFNWIRDGGNLYWMSSPVGMFYVEGDELIEVKENQKLFFGKECINLEDDAIALSVLDGNGLTNALALKWNRVLYGLDVTDIEGSFAMGFSQNGYSSISMVPFGKGMICVFGGSYDRYLCDDVAQTVASGISCYTEVIKICEGTVTRTSTSWTTEIPADTDNVTVYTHIGGYYTVYGRAVSDK